MSTQATRQVRDSGQRPPTMVSPTLSYDDAQAAIAFLTTAFGFEPRDVHTDPEDPANVVHAELSWPPGGAVMLGSAPAPTGGPTCGAAGRRTA